MNIPCILLKSNYKYIKHILSLILLCCFINSFSQISYQAKEGFVKELSDSLFQLRDEDDTIKARLANEINAALSSVLSDSGSFYYKFDQLKHVGVVSSPDNKIRFFQWNYIAKDGSGKHFGLIQCSPSGKSLCRTFVLNETFEKINNSDILYKRMSNKNWYGALYYAIIPQKTNKGEVYTLLGSRYNSLFTTMKIIETLQINEKSDATFGIPIINVATKKQVRLIFEYSNQTSMGLKYYGKKKTIVFDHLAPDIPLHSGNYKYYGPDFSYDALLFENDHWNFLPNFDYKQSEDEIRKGPKPKIIRNH